MKGFKSLCVGICLVAILVLTASDAFAQGGRRGNGGFRGPRRGNGNVNFNFNGGRRGNGGFRGQGRRGGTVIINQFGQPVPVGGFAVPYGYGVGGLGVPIVPFAAGGCY